MLRHLIRLTAAVAASAVLATGALAEDKLKIGYVGGFTGWMAFYDGAQLEGVKLAIDQINKAGGIDGKFKIELATRDMRSEPPEATVMAQELLAEGVHVAISPCDGDPTIATGQVFAAKGIPVISSCNTAPTTPLLGGPNVFISYAADNVQGAVLAQYATKSGFKSALTLSSKDNIYTDKLPVYFAKAFEAMGGKVLGNIEFKIGQPDFNAEVTKIKAMNPLPDVIMTSAFEPEFPIFIKALRGAGVTIPVLETDGIDSPTTYALGDVVEGVIMTNAGFPTAGSKLEAFNADYKAMYNQDSQTVYNANGYNIIQIFEAAVKATGGNLDGAALTAAIDNLEGLDTITGKLTYKGMSRVPLVNVAVNKITGGKKSHVEDVMIDPALIPKPE